MAPARLRHSAGSPRRFAVRTRRHSSRVPVSAIRDAAPVVILGVSRSGTTLLKEMLDRHPDLAIPSESYFISQLWDRHRAEVDADGFAADLARLERIAAWGVDPADVRARLPARAPFAEAVQAIYACYAEARGCRRFGDKTPLYMQRLACVARAFLALDFSAAMLESPRAVDASLLADHPLLAGPPQPARSSWRDGIALGD